MFKPLGKNKLVEPEQVPIIEVENPSEASGDNEVKVKSDQPEVEASPATNDGSSDPPAQPVAETGTGKEKKKTPEANKFGSDNKRKDKGRFLTIVFIFVIIVSSKFFKPL